MDRKGQLNRSEEEKREIVQEGLRSGQIAELCRNRGLDPHLWYRWMEEAEQAAKAALAERIAAPGVIANRSREESTAQAPGANSPRPMTRYRLAVIQGHRMKFSS
jgi:transposase-like protein